MRRSGLVVGVVLALVAAGCGGGGEGPSSGSGPAEPVGIDVRSETLVDTGRGAARSLETAIYVPREPAAGLPLVVFVHGSGGNPDFYKVLLEAWAGSGYVVAAPRFPAAVVDQPADVSFVIGELLRGPHGGRIDPARIGVAGHSAGGAAVLGTVFNTCCVDRRIRAGVVLAGDAPPFPGGTYFTGIRTPLLVVHGVADPTVPFAEGRRVFTDASPPKWLLTVPPSGTPSADHARPYVGTENRPLADTRVVMATTTGFFDRYVRGDVEGLARVRRTVDAEIGFELEVVEG